MISHIANNIEKNTNLVKQFAAQLGFDYCGISKAEFLAEEAPRFETWLNQNKHGKMSYMENYFDKRLDPRLLVPDAKSIVSLMLNYYPEQLQNNEAPKISKYAYGNDYHEVIKGLLVQMMDKMREVIGDINGRVFVDSAPVMDKAWAKKSGMGWMGKNTNIINKQKGSFFFIAELIIDLELIPDGAVKDYCGTCKRCIDACPTDALVAPYKIDASKCISYFTIELKDEIPLDVKGKFNDWAFGCDICQDVCPWNRFSKPHHHQELKPNETLLNWSKNDWYDISEEVFKVVLKHSPIKRTKYQGLKRNLNFIKPL